MKIENVNVVENEDGSATIYLDLDSEARETFIRIGLMAAIKETLKDAEKLVEKKVGEVGASTPLNNSIYDENKKLLAETPSTHPDTLHALSKDNN